MTSAPRPVGFMQPVSDRARRAIVALAEGRISAVQAHLDAIDERTHLDRSWKLLIQGRLCCERRQFAEADVVLLRAAALALQQALESDDDSTTEAVRLRRENFRVAAAALESAGLALRRRDMPHEARRLHAAALALRRDHGSVEEQWESELSLGLADLLLRRPDGAERWFQSAIRSASAAAEHPLQKQAVVWTHLASLLTDRDRHDEAVQAARNARDLWQHHDPGSLETLRAKLQWCKAFIRRAESLITREPPKAGELLRSALQGVNAVAEEITAFGESARADAAHCERLLDFARRLLAACDEETA